MATGHLLELGLGLAEGKGRDALLERGEGLRRESRLEQLPVGSQVIDGRDVVVGQVLPHLGNRILRGLGGGALSPSGSRQDCLATIGYYVMLLAHGVELGQG